MACYAPPGLKLQAPTGRAQPSLNDLFIGSVALANQTALTIKTKLLTNVAWSRLPSEHNLGNVIMIKNMRRRLTFFPGCSLSLDLSYRLSVKGTLTKEYSATPAPSAYPDRRKVVPGLKTLKPIS
jgi:hypothetical protein